MKYHQNYAAKYKLFGKNLRKQLIIAQLPVYFIPNCATILGAYSDEKRTIIIG
jgi:hypothetical protein